MKIFTLLIFLVSISFIFPQQKYYTFSELKGTEDAAGHTHLFYRLYYSHQTNNSYEFENSIYHLDLNSGTDTLFLFDGGGYGPVGDPYFTGVFDYEFWNNNPDEFIYTGYYSSTDPTSYIRRYDNEGGYSQLGDSYFYNVEISHQNDSLLFANVNGLLKSTDGGRAWSMFDPLVTLQSLSPQNDKIIFASDSLSNLIKSTNGGTIFSIVDTNKSELGFDQHFGYDPDGIHIYRIIYDYNKYELMVSADSGNAYSWEVKYSDTSKIFLSMNASQSGEIYLAVRGKIYVSYNYGSTFNLFKGFDRNLIGIYKKPNSQFLYAATKYDLYEISPDTTINLKHLSPDPDLFKWYPLKIGDKWFYQEQVEAYTNALTVEVIGDSIINGKLYYLSQYLSPGSQTTYTLERIDTTDGRIYRSIDGIDVPYYDFTAQTIGDSVLFDRGNNYEYGWVLGNQEPFNQWGINSTKNTYNVVIYGSGFRIYNFVKGVGLYGDQGGEVLYTQTLLKGFMKDGIVYGDTILAVDSKKPETITNFNLEQNYPNPFNPTTIIKWELPKASHVTLKIYNVIGQEVKTIVDKFENAGVHQKEFSASGLSSGIYFYRLKAGSFIQTKKMIILK